MNHTEAVLNRHVDVLLEALVARLAKEPRHSVLGHICPECDLLRVIKRCPERTCTTCMGAGDIGVADDSVPCPACYGSGTPVRPGAFKPMPVTMVNIKGIPKEEILAALYNAARVQGLGVLADVSRKPMTVEMAKDLLKEFTYFDYLMGRPLKVDLNGDELDTRLYDRDNGGPGAAWEVLKGLLAVHGGAKAK